MNASVPTLDTVPARAAARPGPTPPRAISRQDLRADLLAGLSTGVLLVPQSVAYAQLAGLPPLQGLYAAIAGTLTYAVLGRSHALAVGPVAVDSVLAGAVIGPLAQGDVTLAVELSAVLALLVGAIQWVAGWLKGGFLVNFVSAPVLSGFTSAAAITILLSQLPTFLQTTARSPGPAARELWANGLTQPMPVILGAATVACLYLLQRFRPRWPRAILVLGAASVVVAFVPSLVDQVRVVGQIAGGVPVPHFPVISLAMWKALIPAAFAIAIVGFVEGWSSARRFEKRLGELRADHELRALGASNLAAGLFKGMVLTGGLSRSALQAASGARTRLSGLVAGVIALAIVVLLPSLLAPLPRPALAGLIVMSVIPLFEWQAPLRLYRIRRDDAVMWGVTFGATLLAGLVNGILIGVASSLVWFIYRTSTPHIAVLGRLPGSRHFRNVANHPEAITIPELLIVRIDAQLYFGNVSFVADTLTRLREERPALRVLVLDAVAINQLDTSAQTWLEDLLRSCREAGIHLALASVKMPVRRVMDAAGFVADDEHLTYHSNVDEAVQWLHAYGHCTCLCDELPPYVSI
jgi:SulP family sulfate permease